MKTNSEYAILTNDIYHAWSDLTAREYKTFKGLTNESLRDNMSDLELALSTLAEATTAEVERATDPESLPEHREVARSGGAVAGTARAASSERRCPERPGLALKSVKAARMAVRTHSGFGWLVAALSR